MRTPAKLGGVALAIALCAAWAGGARAQNATFAEFQTLCIDTRADPAAARTAAQGAGLTEAPPALLDRVNQQLGLLHPELLVSPPGSGHGGAIVLGDKTVAIGGHDHAAAVCVLITIPADADAEAAVAAWAGVAPIASGPDKQPSFVFSGPPGRHHAVQGVSDAEGMALIRGGGVQFALATHTGDGSLLMYGIFRPD